MKLPLTTAALSTTYVLISLAKADARAYCNNRRRCYSDFGGCWRRGRRAGWIGNSWELSPIDRISSMLDTFHVSQRNLAETISRPPSPPRYDITENKEKMKISLDLPGVHPEDISIELRNDGRTINIAGSRKHKGRRDKIVTSKFEQTFTIDSSVIDVNSIDANLSEGVLVVSARKKKPKTVPTTRNIPIRAIIKKEGGGRSKASIDDTDTNSEANVMKDTSDEVKKKEMNSDGIEISEEEDTY